MLSPKEAHFITESQIAVRWNDGAESFFTAQQLRQACRCANCVHEMSGEPILNPSSVAPDLTFLDWQQVGNYAYQFHFSDGHNSGIYAFDYLRSLK